MAKVIKCDRCGKQIKNNDSKVIIDMFDDTDLFKDDINNMLLKDKLPSKMEYMLPILKPTLCNKCLEDYNKLILNFNKEIKRFIKHKSFA